MKDLVEIYSAQEILLFLVIFASAVKGFVSFWDWGYARLKQMFKKGKSIAIFIEICYRNRKRSCFVSLRKNKF